MKILNLYACLGGNRYKWNEVKEDIEVTAIELDPEAARLYQERFPNDTVIIADAHQYLLDHYKEFDFIWSSPPCPTHSRARFARRETTSAAYPDMKLYEEILFLDKWFKGKYVVENVIPYYEPLVHAKKRGRHLYWTNFNLPSNLGERKGGIMEGKDEVTKWCVFHAYNFRKYKGTQSVQKMARNLVDYEVGKTIFETMLGIVRREDINQEELF
jgi:DNA (cytosine-5)-methyltransferase 1|tara:strand:- start:385 stop:1026 length:642 start_codon:yes stop_codon:yes gene_type:complete